MHIIDFQQNINFYSLGIENLMAERKWTFQLVCVMDFTPTQSLRKWTGKKKTEGNELERAYSWKTTVANNT